MNMELTNNYKVSLPLAVWCANDTYDFFPKDREISATSLLRPIKQIVFNKQGAKRTSIDLMDLFAARRGTALHAAIESAWEKNYKANLQLLGYDEKFIDKIIVNPREEDIPPKDSILVFTEKRFYKAITLSNGATWNISGQADLIFNGELHDYKSTSTYTYVHQSKVEDYILQGSIYKFLSENTLGEITSDVININYIFTDWLKYKAKLSKEYPQCPCITKQYSLLSREETLKFLKEKLELLENYLYSDPCDANELVCPNSELWLPEPEYKYYSKVDAVKASKKFTNKDEAYAYLNSKGKGIIKVVNAPPKRCLYCDSFEHCIQGNMYYPDGKPM